MKKLFIILALLLGWTTPAEALIYPNQGGTGSTTLSGILFGNGTGILRTLTIGSNLTLTGTTLSSGDITFSTTSADYWLTLKPLGGFFSTTSSDYWDTTKARWATTSANYAIGVSLAGTTTTAIAEGNNLYYTSARDITFSTTSAAYWDTTISRWATTSSNYWETQQTRWATTSANYAIGASIAGTTTTALAEGTNKYYTDVRADARIDATSTLAQLLYLPSLLRSTTTNATTTAFFASLASTTNLFGANLLACNGASNALTWSNGLFGCNTISSVGGGASPDFNKQLNFGVLSLTPTTTIPIWANNGVFASSTSQFANLQLYGSTSLQDFTALRATTTSATTTSLAVTGLANVLMLTNGTGGVIPFSASASCSNQFMRAISSAGASTCASVANTDLVSSAITINGTSVSLGGTITVASTTLLANNNTWSGFNVFTASTTLQNFTGLNATTSNATTSSLAVTNVLSALYLANATGGVGAYGGTSCTNQFVRSLNGSGASTCATVANTDLTSSAIMINGTSVSLGGTITVASTTLLANTNTWSGINAFQTITFTNGTSTNATSTNSSWALSATGDLGRFRTLTATGTGALNQSLFQNFTFVSSTGTDATSTNSLFAGKSTANTSAFGGTASTTFSATGHINATTTTALVPTLATCGTTPLFVSGNDTAGIINIGTGGIATACTLTFKNAYAKAPACIANDATATLLVRASSTQTTLLLTSASAWAASSLISYICIGSD